VKAVLLHCHDCLIESCPCLGFIRHGFTASSWIVWDFSISAFDGFEPPTNPLRESGEFFGEGDVVVHVGRTSCVYAIIVQAYAGVRLSYSWGRGKILRILKIFLDKC